MTNKEAIERLKVLTDYEFCSDAEQRGDENIEQ